MEALNQWCLHAAIRLVADGQYATIDSVVHCVAQLSGFPPLPPHEVPNVPALALMLQIEQSVASYAHAFIATHGVATLRDFEHETVSMLHARCIPPLMAGSRVQDSTDSSYSGSACGCASDGIGHGSSFHDFGVGPLALHPTVRSIWNTDEIGAPARMPAFVDVAQHLIPWLARQPSLRGQASGTSKSSENSNFRPRELEVACLHRPDTHLTWKDPCIMEPQNV